jgi:hypothetical protein
MKELPVFRKEFSARKWPLFIIFGPILAFLLISKPQDSRAMVAYEWLLFGIILVVILFHFVLLKLKLVIDNEGLQLKMLLKTEEIFWNSITKSNLYFEIYERSADVKWIFENDGRIQFSFSPTYFCRTSLQQVAAALILKSQNAQISEKVQKMAEGKFPWYIF